VNPRYFHQFAVVAYLGLFGLLMIWQTILFPSTHFPIALGLLFSITPLLIPLRGFLNANKRNCSWMAFLSLFYFIHGVIESYANADERWLACIEIFLSLLLFFGTVFYVRAFAKRSHD
jgi:uncharacterized membrane protein